MSEKRIPKEDRAFLYFRENGRGYLNIKFGPEKYTKDTSKFYEVLMSGIFQSVMFLANIGKEAGLQMEDLENNYETLRIGFQAILFEAFPEVAKKIEQESRFEEIAIEATEAGEKIPVENEEEFQRKIEETKASLKEKSTEEVVSRNLEKDKKEIEEAVLVFEGIIEKLQNNEELTKEQTKVILNFIANAYLKNLEALEELKRLEDK